MKRAAGLAVLLVVLFGMTLATWWIWPRATPVTLEPGRIDTALRDPMVIARGRYLAQAGDCASCHSVPGGTAYAGGRLMRTPFGELPAPNLTPDVQTGLGSWQFDDFWHALHDGIGRDYRLLYPVFSFPSFTRVTQDDALAIFAYLRSLPAAHAAPLSANLRFPYSWRPLLMLWRAVYFRPETSVDDPRQSAAWNRGAYLVQGLGHCAECHAERDRFGGMLDAMSLRGGTIPALQWYAPGLSMQRGGTLGDWHAQDLIDLLHAGQSAKGVAVGPMAEVVSSSTQFLSRDDLAAMAVYLQSLPAPPPGSVADTSSIPADDDADTSHAAELYHQHCAACHGDQGEGAAGVYPALDGNVDVREASGVNAIRMVLLGGFAPTTAAQPRPYSMPPYAQQLSDAQVAAVVSYIRQAWHNHAGAVRERDVAHLRQVPLD